MGKSKKSKHLLIKQPKKPKLVFGIFCRSVGPGGTSVDFYATPEGLKAVWENENCPYEGSHKDHNISWLYWQEIQDALKFAKKKRWVKE
jgi:hypothetical protein